MKKSIIKHKPPIQDMSNKNAMKCSAFGEKHNMSRVL